MFHPTNPLQTEPDTGNCSALYYRGSLCRLLTYMAIVFMCPLIGAWLSGKALQPYLMFPPVPQKTTAPAFSWLVFCSITAISIICVKPFLSNIMFAPRQSIAAPPARHCFPLWGWLGLSMMAIAWFVAWNRFEWFESVQEFTFTPLWLSYILVINGLTYRRVGRCLLICHRQYHLVLFFISAVLWWSFEYLNRFVENWYYVGISDFGPGRYFIHATIPFSTVLPAVLGTAEWLHSFPRISAGVNHFKPLSFAGTKFVSLLLVGAAAAGFTVLAIWPQMLFFLVWLLPILLVAGLQSLTETPALIADINAGDWRRIWLLAVSGLICGLFWEMWNVNSLAHWQYNVPYVQRFEIFAMPLLGYLGYLPFGIFCGLFSDFVLPLPLKKD